MCSESANLYQLWCHGETWWRPLVSECILYHGESDNVKESEQEVKVIRQKAPHGGPIPRLGVTPGGRKLYH